ncbi:TrmH family RNA methyltransferase [Halalkalibacter oceani]|uniref:RNA methyltransferase n=1 Tax=Halalkalibacter oceani TaxID=1653776 RepID=A0A9X2DTU7_9BACI|nr:RNA methyltransferase [Halalkalibacter oceani]MCM3716010.1 RNA methyltransferase [Halalkalibacter oceani]
MRRIDSSKNEQIKAWKKLHTKKGREKAGQFLVEGFHLVEEALRASIKVNTVLLTDETIPPQEWPLAELDVIMISPQVMKELAETETPQGVIAVCELPETPDAEITEGKYLLVDRVQDPGNLGTMIRTADSAGLTGVIVGDGCVDIFNGKLIRASQGSIFHLPVLKGDLVDWVERCKQAQIPVFGTALKGASSYSAIEPQRDFALLMGNEGEGVSEELLELTDQNLYIPIYGEAESLNVAVATGILLYYLRG